MIKSFLAYRKLEIWREMKRFLLAFWFCLFPAKTCCINVRNAFAAVLVYDLFERRGFDTRPDIINLLRLSWEIRRRGASRTMTDDSLSPIDAPCCDIVEGRNIKCSMTVTKTYEQSSTAATPASRNRNEKWCRFLFYQAVVNFSGSHSIPARERQNAKNERPDPGEKCRAGASIISCFTRETKAAAWFDFFLLRMFALKSATRGWPPFKLNFTQLCESNWQVICWDQWSFVPCKWVTSGVNKIRTTVGHQSTAKWNPFQSGTHWNAGAATRNKINQFERTQIVQRFPIYPANFLHF